MVDARARHQQLVGALSELREAEAAIRIGGGGGERFVVLVLDVQLGLGAGEALAGGREDEGAIDAARVGRYHGATGIVAAQRLVEKVGSEAGVVDDLVERVGQHRGEDSGRGEEPEQRQKPSRDPRSLDERPDCFDPGLGVDPECEEASSRLTEPVAPALRVDADHLFTSGSDHDLGRLEVERRKGLGVLGEGPGGHDGVSDVRDDESERGPLPAGDHHRIECDRGPCLWRDREFDLGEREVAGIVLRDDVDGEGAL